MDFFSVWRYMAQKGGSAHEILSRLTQVGLIDLKTFPRWEADLYERFLSVCEGVEELRRAQIFQDIFVDSLFPDSSGKTFLEFGAVDGLLVSNTYFLEHSRGWTGALCEPNPELHDKLGQGRPNSVPIFECMWEKSGETLSFFSSNCSELSALEEFIAADQDTFPITHGIRTQGGTYYNVKTISLNDTIETYFNGKAPDYISADTEGSEYAILSALDFEKYKPKVFTIEHNHTETEANLDQLLDRHNYVRVFRNLTAFDAWYVHQDLLASLRD